MHLKIYFGNKPLFLCDAIDETIEPLIHHDDAVFIDELNIHTIKTMIHEMQQEKVHAGVFFHQSLEELKKTFFKKFELIQAAGGLVQNDKDEILLIFRRGKWDLPKGKLDEDETLEQCAIREVEEETGLKNIELLSPLIVTYHTYHQGTSFVLKESYWYKMKVNGQQQLIPQTIEDIEKVIWVKPRQLTNYFLESYPSVVEVLTLV
ncbi:MAG: NUDIX hydrolase [Bacteroidetes bacterium]|nr:NUDIX hydrolase [Bacteroidota bacterium]